ncbi:hypothetical protein JTE90_027819 [Oedothorax gibbosus]|uniref:Reverse transcriptase domain-containing protein n=1 Tax=Oedothorax gibbosus TaxID=931172 RepID=A0AAV6V985_9ARAC|nr:hypothetical protein JTE90_027819 [Oedothorax gibbosus]
MPRRLHPKSHDAVKAEFVFLLSQGIIRPSKSPWSSPLHVVPKQDSTSKTFPSTAVTTHWGLYEYTRLCFELVNAPQTFMHGVLRGLPFCYVYLDDILCFSESHEEHKGHLKTIFERLQAHGLKLNISKCQFGVPELTFLGHLVTAQGLKPLPEKVDAVLQYQLPETIAALRKFLGLLNFYRRFVPKAAEHQCLLHSFLKGSKGNNRRIDCSPQAVAAFEKSKHTLAETTLLCHPAPSAPLALHVDASDFAIGGALHQVIDGELQPLAFFSRKSSPAEISYSAYDPELLAAYSSVKHFRHMLEAREFIIYTDHKPLTFAFRQ